MKNPLIVIVCCVIPLAIIGLILFSGGERIDHSSMPQQSAEKQTKVGTTVGNIFPEFSVIDVDGVAITNDTLKRRPAIIWFTTTWCTPCQIGAKKVAQLQNELGGNKLNVLVFFVDPKESTDDLRNWRSQFANPDWKLAFNNGLAEKVGIKFLDSKYLLDKDGVIRDFNTRIADDQYLSLIRVAAKDSQ